MRSDPAHNDVAAAVAVGHGEAPDSGATPVVPQRGQPEASVAEEGVVPANAVDEPPPLPPRDEYDFKGDLIDLKREVRKIIRTEQIQLWNPPYSQPDGRSTIPKALVDKLAVKVSAKPAMVFDALEL